MDEEAFNELVLAIRTGNCILFTGPDLALVEKPAGLDSPIPGIGVNGNGKVKIADLVSDRLYRDLRGDEEVAPDAGLAHIAQVYLWSGPIERGRNRLLSKIEQVYNEYRDRTTSLHEAIASLPFRVVISTSPDHFLENAYRIGKEKEPVVDYFDFKELRANPIIPETDRTPLIYNLTGSLERPLSLVVSEDDLLEYLLKIVKVGIPSNLAQVIRNPNTVFLFLGFGLYRWYLRILLKVLLETASRENSSFAFEFDLSKIQGSAAGAGSQGEGRVFYKLGHRILVLDGSPDEVVTRLEEAFRTQGAGLLPQADGPPKRLPLQGAKIFLSYRRMDADKPVGSTDPISAIEASLVKAGGEVWRDRTALRGGDDWESKIKTALASSDYFVFVQSRNTESPDINRANPIESYWRIEVDYALERLKKFAKVFRFLFPVRIEECHQVAELEHLQHIDLFVDRGTETLVREMSEDWQLRKRESK